MTELLVEPIPGDDGAGVAGLTVRGELDHDNADDFLDAFRSALPGLRADGDRVLIDCAEVRSCDYSGLSALLMARREAGKIGARLILVRQSPPLAALLSVAGVSELASDDDLLPEGDLPPDGDSSSDSDPLSEGEMMAVGDGAGSEDLSEDLASGQTNDSRTAGPDRDSPGPGTGYAEVTVSRARPVPVITLAGQVDLDSVEDLVAAFDTAREGARDGRIVVDLSRLEFADSTTLHVLLQARAASDLWLVGPLRPQVRLLFQITDLLDAFRFADDLDEATGTRDRAS